MEGHNGRKVSSVIPHDTSVSSDIVMCLAEISYPLHLHSINVPFRGAKLSTPFLFLAPTMDVGLGYIPLLALYTNQELTDLWRTHKTEGVAMDRDRHLQSQTADMPQQAEHVTCSPENLSPMERWPDSTLRT